jgi:hypothetical protein
VGGIKLKIFQQMKQKLNVRLLRRIQRRILKEPRQFQMDDLYSATDDFGKEVTANCGTAACIAGWAVALSSGISPREASILDSTGQQNTWGLAVKKLGLESGRPLFLVYEWPGKFWAAYERAKTNRQQAKVAVARIEHFIKTKGEE